MRSELDFYFDHCPSFVKRLDLLRGFKDKGERIVAVLDFVRQFQLLDAHAPVISYYAEHGQYQPELIETPITLIDYDRGVVVGSPNPRQDFKRYYEGKTPGGLHIEIDGDVNAERVKEFVEANSTAIREALDHSHGQRTKRFTPIPTLERYIQMADEYYSPSNTKTQEQIAHDYDFAPSTASTWIKRLRSIMPPE